MAPESTLNRGAAALEALLAERTFDVRSIDHAAAFRRWLAPHLDRWSHDPVFIARSSLREIRREHPDLATLESEYRRAALGCDRTDEGRRLRAIEQLCEGAGKAIAGLERALEAATSEERRRALAAKLSRVHVSVAALDSERAMLLCTASECRDAGTIHRRLAAMRERLGIDRHEKALRLLGLVRGRGSGRAGAEFERDVERAVVDHILPELAVDRTEVVVLRGVQLGAARVELDLVVVRLVDGRRSDTRPRDETHSVDVLAIVEAKRNINDLAHGLRLRLENIAWLTGDRSGYDPALYRTKRFTQGHFDAVATHETTSGAKLRFDVPSFARLAPENPRDRNLYLATRPGPLWGMSASSLARLAYRISTDTEWEPGSNDYLERLLTWTKRLTHPVEATDILRSAIESPTTADRILLIQRAVES